MTVCGVFVSIQAPYPPLPTNLQFVCFYLYTYSKKVLFIQVYVTIYTPDPNRNIYHGRCYYNVACDHEHNGFCVSHLSTTLCKHTLCAVTACALSTHCTKHILLLHMA